MDADLDTLATALYVATDELMAAHPERVPERPAGGFPSLISDAELCTLAVMQALLGFTSERRWLRHANAHLAGMFPHLLSSMADLVDGRSRWSIPDGSGCAFDVEAARLRP